MALAALDLDLEVFQGPFDLLLALVLREDVDLLEVDLAEVVLAYVDHLEARGELDLDSATEFLALMAALLELKSRLMLPHDDEGGQEPPPSEAIDELLARLVEYRRYRGAAEHLRGLLAAEEAFRYRSAPLPAAIRRAALPAAGPAYDARVLAQAIGSLLRAPVPLDVGHIARPVVSLEARLAHLRTLLGRRAEFSFDEAVAGADRTTEAVTLFALLELYKAGEAQWEQAEPFGAIRVRGRRA